MRLKPPAKLFHEDRNLRGIHGMMEGRRRQTPSEANQRPRRAMADENDDVGIMRILHRASAGHAIFVAVIVPSTRQSSSTVLGSIRRRARPSALRRRGDEPEAGALSFEPR